MGILYFLHLSLVVTYVLLRIADAVDTIIPPQSLRDGVTLVSKEGNFELGFFSPGDPDKRYLGVWYKNIPIRTVVWVANREKPINDTLGILKIDSTGSLVLLSHTGSVAWTSGSSRSEADKLVLQLLDSGNLVLKDEKDSHDSNSYLWQSFDHPSDTFLPGMKLGRNLKTGLDRRLSSWRSAVDPTPGELTYGMELHNYPEAVVWKGSNKYYRTGPWNGLRFSGSPELRPNPVFEYKFVTNMEEVYYSYQLKNKSVISRIALNQTNYSRQRYIWVEAHQSWEVYTSVPRDLCDTYGLCGAYGICVFSESPVCQCLKGFKPKSQEKWNLMDWSQGCIRDKPLNCHQGGFVKFEGLKLPDTTYSWVNTSMNLRECRAQCVANCSCVAYTNSDIRGGGSGCAMWFSDLIDIRQFPVGGQELYIRMPASELGTGRDPKVKRAVIIGASISIASGMLVISYCICRRKNLKEKAKNNNGNEFNNNERREEDLELPSFNLATIASATDNFSFNNKLGEGGFGPVYKGRLSDGQEIAVKRLSANSTQGLNEFKNEVILIAKLQHRNLVKLLGCCIQGEEMMLIYEYMPNQSLDSFIFDQDRADLLDWSKRFDIICGIARGLLYLHQDSRLRIIHRDLKASNILLDNEMNPKISDFGLAKSFGNEQSAGNTKRVVGTFGYMAPEYAVDGLFSIKSDVFSFGVLLLEIVIGKKNRGFYHKNHSLNLIGHAWKLWKEGRPLELVSDLYLDCSLHNVLRCIHVGLLCVQQRPEDRPNMSSVILMLVSESAMPQPKQPGFFIDRNPLEEEESSSSRNKSCSTNEITITLLDAR